MSHAARTREMDPDRDAGSSNRAATRLAWSVWAACVVLIALALLMDFATPEFVGFWVLERPGPLLAVLTGVLTVTYPAVGALIVSRLPAHPIGWVFCGVGLLFAAQRFTIAYADYALLENLALAGGEYVAWFSTLMAPLIHLLAGVFLILLFPNGRLPSRRWRVVTWTALLGAASTALGGAFVPGGIPTHYYIDNPFGVAGVIGGGLTTYDLFPRTSLLGMALLLASSLAALLSLILRLRRARGDERQQLKWFLYPAVPAILCQNVLLVQSMSMDLAEKVLFDTAYILPWEDFTGVRYVAILAMLVLPVFTYIAILRYHLYDIDLLINRTLVYGLLSTCVVGLYVLSVGGLGALFQSQGNLGISLVATGIVAILFQPLRSKLQRSVNRLMYGERDDPYAVISRLGRRLEAAVAPEAVLTTVTETIAQALKLPYAAILLKEGEGFRTAAAYGSPTGEPETLPLVFQREEIGHLVIAPRAPGEEFSAADRRLLEDLARQAEVAVHAVRLTTDLQRSRERLVATREEERRRLRRDLHDGFGPTLASLALGLNVARKLLANREQRDAEEVLARLEQEAEDTVTDVRRLIYGLRPPALDDLGLIAAIRHQAESHGFVAEGDPRDAENKAAGEDGSVFFSLETSEDQPPLPAAVEVACYRIAQEALTNVARHAHAKACRVRLSVDRASGVLALDVRDDGVGMPEGGRAGVGLSSMRERAEELGGTCCVELGSTGGTRVLARLPLPNSEKRLERARSPWSTPSAS